MRLLSLCALLLWPLLSSGCEFSAEAASAPPPAVWSAEMQQQALDGLRAVREQTATLATIQRLTQQIATEQTAQAETLDGLAQRLDHATQSVAAPAVLNCPPSVAGFQLFGDLPPDLAPDVTPAPAPARQTCPGPQCQTGCTGCDCQSRPVTRTASAGPVVQWFQSRQAARQSRKR